MKKIRLQNLLSLSLLFVAGILKSQTGLPDWPIVTNETNSWFDDSKATTNTNVVHWSGPDKPTTLKFIDGTPSKKSGAAQPLYDDCGNMLYYLIHNGFWRDDKDNNNDGVENKVTNLETAKGSSEKWGDTPGLRIVNADGSSVRLPSDVVMFANAGDGEVQVIKRPGTTNQWFIIYTSHVNNREDGKSPAYEAGLLRYSLVEIKESPFTGSEGIFVSDDKGEIFNRILWNDQPRSGHHQHYSHSKATTPKINFPATEKKGHYLFAQRRNNDQDYFYIDRFIVDESKNIQFDKSSPKQESKWWGSGSKSTRANPIRWSPMEFSPNGELAINIRNYDNNTGSIYIIKQDLEAFKTIINLPDLLVEPDANHAELDIPYTLDPDPSNPKRSPSGYLSVNNLANSNVKFTTHETNLHGKNGFEFMDNFERKVAAIEFSPDGRYLYFVGGGYSRNGRSNATYLGQIELDPVFLEKEGAYKVRLQIQWPSIENEYGFDHVRGEWSHYYEEETDEEIEINIRDSHQNERNPWITLEARATLAQNQITNIQSAYDGNLYFTKRNTNQLWVIPEPNKPLETLLDPRDIDLSTLSEPNITGLKGFPNQLPDQIDWYDYQETDWTNIEDVRFGEEGSACGCENVDVWLVDVSNGESIRNFSLNSCTEQLDICVENNKSYNLESSNGTKITNAIVNGQLNYPAGKDYFDFETSLGENVTIKVKNQKTECSDCAPISFTIHEKEISDSDSDCDFPDWNQGNYSNYQIGDIVSDNGEYWQAINIGHTHRQPSGTYGHYGWELVVDPCPANDNPGDSDPIEFYSEKCEDEFTLCIENNKSYFIEYPSDPDVLHELSFINGEVVYPDNLDFYDISEDDGLVKVSFTINNYKNNLNTCEKECEPVTVRMFSQGLRGAGLVTIFNSCELIEICVDKNKTYHFQADYSMVNNAIVNGVVQAENGIFDVTRDYRPLENHVFNFEYKVAESCEMVCFDDKIDVAIEATNIGAESNGLRHLIIENFEHKKTETIDACGNLEICIDPLYDYYAEFNGVRHLIFSKSKGKIQKDVFSFTTEEVTAATCCPVSLGIDIDNEDFLYISDNITINQNTIWDNKVYIEQDKIVTVDGVTLDITSMDVIFGECAGINFINGATLRASNSVFRPCDLNKTWRGLKFDATLEPSTLGILNECIFKNAIKAVDIGANGGGQNVNLRFTNNLFSNCQNGISLTNVTLNRSITGNTFQIDNDKPDFASNCQDENPDISSGITIISTQIKAEIAQNDFVNMATDWKFLGLAIFQSNGGSISKNTFTNNLIALSLGYSNQISIEDNAISITSLASSDKTQFSVAYANNIRITGNTFYNSDLNYSSLTQTSSSANIAAVGVNYASLINIKSNDIIGFENGILAFEVSNSNIGENNIKDAWHYGVYALGPTNLDISCNTINMELTDGGTTVGVGVFYQNSSTPNDNSLSSIRGNCIFETSTAIHIEDQSYSGNSTSPSIKNNYLYNYTNNGIAFQNVNATSAIGSGLTQTTAGKNTFISNNIPFGAVDVNASATSSTTLWGCFGVSSVNGPVNLRGGDLYNSTASCGSQIGTINSGIQADEICDRIEGNEHLYPSQSFEGRSYMSTQFELIEPTEIDVNNKVNIGLDQLEIYPNPASNEVNVEMNSTESDLSVINIYQINGKLIRSVETVGQNVKINVNIEDLATGAYMVRVVSNEKVIGQSKLIVTK